MLMKLLKIIYKATNYYVSNEKVHTVASQVHYEVIRVLAT